MMRVQRKMSRLERKWYEPLLGVRECKGVATIFKGDGIRGVCCDGTVPEPNCWGSFVNLHIRYTSNMGLYRQCTNIAVLVWIVYSPYLRGHQRANCVKGTWDLSMLSCNFLCIILISKLKVLFLFLFREEKKEIVMQTEKKEMV